MPIQELISIPELSREDFGSLCICAVRYCLGRKSYMPSDIQRIISLNIEQLSDKDLGVIKSDIQKHGGPTHDIDAYGDYIDYRDWCGFLRIINNEIDKRKEVWE